MTVHVQNDSIATTAIRMRLSGLVQGVGMRPAIARLATDLGLCGRVRNVAGGVDILLEGKVSSVESFPDQLRRRLPAGAIVRSSQTEPGFLEGFPDFRIEDSPNHDHPESTEVPLDTAVCSRCREEIRNIKNRRFGYEFTSCTDCGPRYSLIESMPYDRSRTTMRDFTLCAECLGEYLEPGDRRFHAQTNACPECGPQLKFVDPEGKLSSGDTALTDAAEAVLAGRILALKGLGGYQLVCRAADSRAVKRLRLRKRRPHKPLAVMVRSVEEAQKFGILNDQARHCLTAALNPIVLVRARQHSGDSETGGGLSPLIHPGLDQIGLMLPTTPLHLLLLDRIGSPCVMTSGNRSSEPLVYRNVEARRQLLDVADVWLHHDRRIERPVDDSVIRCSGGQRVTIRAARGLAPLPLQLSTEESILAVGAHQKVALALAGRGQAVLGPHIGDLDSLAGRQRFMEQVRDLTALYGIVPTRIAHDLHPDLFTTRWALSQHCPTISVQHHHAHTVAGMMEHGWLDRKVLGVAFDGTGYGSDGTIWGGEFLVCDAGSFQRVARFRPLALLGGERAIHQPWRTALALVLAATDRGTALHVLRWVAPSAASVEGGKRQLQQLSSLAETAIGNENFSLRTSGVVWTSSVGRLFDGVAALLLHLDEATYEGEAAARLEAVCDPSATGAYRLICGGDGLVEIDWRPMIRQILQEQQVGIAVGTIAMRFTRAVARAVDEVARRIPDLPIVLTGGCFQNALLTSETHQMLEQQNRQVGLPGRIPPNDGGLAAGQLAVAASRPAESSAQVNQSEGAI